MDSYLARFEKLAQFYGWEKKDCSSSRISFKRLELVFKRWLTLSEVNEDFKLLCDFMIKGQFLSTCSPDVGIFLKEKGNIRNSEMASVADLYRNAHSDKPKFNKHRFESQGGLVSKVKPVSEASIAEYKRPYIPKCYLCGQQGHKKPQYPQLSTRVVPSKVDSIFESELKPQGAIVDPNGEMNGQCAEVSLDTGCGTVLVNPKFVSGSTTGPKCTVYDFLAVIQTRAATRKSRDTTHIATLSTLDLPIDKASFLSSQQECDSLKPVWNSYEKDLSTSHRGHAVKYEVIDNLLYRVCKTSKDPTEVGDKQHVRSPLTILHELLTNEKLEKELRTSYQHVLELRQRLKEGAEVALANVKSRRVTLEE
ncbi:hypothetical protein Pcinc_027592 [Petrolisthes cinctipes]|uniref:CCHC-type domain-containing protein n=1 Tax=Petrolisthes cinctipes TaxID=88211 RepID=A0AAE1F4T0_PETCI|nr:hypothetical protein Pcinc_027592 [Petrolisthes cinctipes]